MIKKIFISGLLLLATLGFSPSVLATDGNHELAADRVIIYMIDKLSLNDVNEENTPYLWSLQEKGGVGLLNTLTGGERTVKNACSTISAGKLAVGSNSAHLNYQADTLINNEKAADVFYRNTGFRPQPENILVTNIQVIQRNNETRNLGQPGLLGDSLQALGLETAVIGNTDRLNMVNRPGALMLMNSKGIVDQGRIEPVGNAPTYWTDYSLLIEQAKSVENSAVILVEYGDLTRLEAMYALFSSSKYTQERQRVLSKIDKSIHQIDQQLASEATCRYIISPSPSRNAYIPNALLTPIIIVKPDNSDNNEGVVLTSYSTRRDGIVLLTSIKNSILSCFTSSTKDPIYMTSNSNPYNYLEELNQRAVFSYANQEWILVVLISWLLLLILGAIILLFKFKSLHMEKLLALISSLPLVLLIMPLFPVFNKYIFVVLAILLGLLITLLAVLLSRLTKVNPLMTILFITIITLCLDLILGLDLIARSIMSYQIIRGARYYGLGNEYMGILIGATISLAALYLNNKYQLIRLRLVKVFFAFIVFLIAYPLFGINVGGTITACVGLGFTLIMFYKAQLNLKDIIGIFIGTGIVLTLMALIDINQPLELQSHLGKNIRLIADQGFQEINNIIERKLEMHLQIINYNYLGWILLTLLVGVALLIFKPINNLLTIKETYPLIYNGLQGIIIAAITAILFNDSGITAAATLSIYFICTLIYALSRERKEI